MLKKRSGVKSVKLSIYPDGSFVVTAPKWYPLYLINRFMRGKSGWIFEHLKNIDWNLLQKKKEREKTEYKAKKEQARKIIQSKIEKFNRHYGFQFGKISVKNQKRCWGSCSGKKNLNFNYKIVFLPDDLRDYIIVHEICHLEELNHKKKFWSLVSETIPNYKLLRRKLRQTKI